MKTIDLVYVLRLCAVVTFFVIASLWSMIIIENWDLLTEIFRLCLQNFPGL